MTPPGDHLLDRARRGALPMSWTRSPAPFGGTWLLGEHDDPCEILYAVAPPGVGARPGEAQAQRLTWRVAAWHGDARHGEPEVVKPLALDDVLVVLGDIHRETVRRTCAAVLRHLDSYAHRLDGRPDEERARAAAGPAGALRLEARLAFPDDDWGIEQSGVVPEVPGTPAELLRQVDGADVARADVLLERLTLLYRRSVRRYRKIRTFKPHKTARRWRMQRM